MCLRLTRHIITIIIFTIRWNNDVETVYVLSVKYFLRYVGCPGIADIEKKEASRHMIAVGKGCYGMLQMPNTVVCAFLQLLPLLLF